MLTQSEHKFLENWLCLNPQREPKVSIWSLLWCEVVFLVSITLSWPWKHFTVYIRFWICTKQPESNLTGQPKSCQFVSFDFTTVFESLSLCKQLSVCPLSPFLLAKCQIHFSQLLKICDCIHVDWSLNSLRLRVLTSEKLKKRIQNVTVSLIEVL